jgi:hypothetical protein
VIDELEPRPSELALDLDFSELRSEVETALQATTDALAEVTHLLALVSAPPLEATTVAASRCSCSSRSSSWSSSSPRPGA